MLKIGQYFHYFGEDGQKLGGMFFTHAVVSNSVDLL